MNAEVMTDFVEIDGLRLRYHRTGRGRSGPVVLGMGPTHKKAAHNSGMLGVLESVADLAPGFAMDNPCTGASSDVPVDYFRAGSYVLKGVAELWQRVFVKLELDLTNCVIFSHCSGCLLATVLIKQLQLKPSLVVFSTPLSRNLAVKPGVAPIIEEEGLWRYTLEAYRRIHPSATEEEVRLANERAVRVRPLRVTELVPWATFKYPEWLGSSVEKLVIIHPERDGVPLAEREELAREMNAQLFVVPEGGHDPDDRTRSTWTELYRRPLASVRSGTAAPDDR